MELQTNREAEFMAKEQKTIMVPGELYRLIQSIERRTGASFTRITIAALHQYLFAEQNGPDRVWMESVVAVEQGEINTGDVPKWLAERELEDVRDRLQEAKEDEEIGCPASPEELGELRKRASELTNTIMGWENILRLADDPIDAVLTFWKRVDSGTLPFEITNAPQEALDKYKKKPGEDVQPSN